MLDMESLQSRLYGIDNLIDTEIPRDVWRAVLNAPEEMETIPFTLDSEEQEAAVLRVLSGLENLIQES